MSNRIAIYTNKRFITNENIIEYSSGNTINKNVNKGDTDNAINEKANKKIFLIQQMEL